MRRPEVSVLKSAIAGLGPNDGLYGWKRFLRWVYLHGRLICPVGTVGIPLVLVAVFVIQAVCEMARSWKPSALFAHEVAADMFICVGSSSGRCR